MQIELEFPPNPDYLGIAPRPISVQWTIGADADPLMFLRPATLEEKLPRSGRYQCQQKM